MKNKIIKIIPIMILLSSLPLHYSNASSTDTKTITAKVTVEPALTLQLSTNTLNFTVATLGTGGAQQVTATVNSNTGYTLGTKGSTFTHSTTSSSTLAPSIFEVTVNSTKNTLNSTEKVVAENSNGGIGVTHTLSFKPIVPLDTKVGIYNGTIDIIAKIK